MKLVEPPSCSPTSTIVFIGKNRRGHWVAQEQNGLYGRLVPTRPCAFRVSTKLQPEGKRNVNSSDTG
jgi:hypothetical protein